MTTSRRWLRRRLIVLCLVAVMVLAGCTGAPPRASPATNETVTLQTESVSSPSPTATPAAVDYDRAPPGVTASGVTTRPLLRSHVRTLRNRSHTITVRETRRTGDRSITQTRVVRVEGPSASILRRFPSRGVEIVDWTDGRTTARRASASGAEPATRFQYNQSRLGLREASARRQLLTLATATNFTAMGTTTNDGRRITVLESRGRPGNRTLQGLVGTTTVSDYRVRIAATEEGRILGLAWNATVGPPTRSVSLRFRYAVSEVGSTTVDRPSWLPTARDRATRLEAGLSSNGRYLRITHSGGDAIPADALVSWRMNPRGQPQSTTLGVRIEANDTVYASVVNESIRFDRDHPANRTTDPLSRGLFLRFVTNDGLPIATVYGRPTQDSGNRTTSPRDG